MGRRTVAIIGSGFSGTVVAIHLLRAAPPGLDRLYLVERVEGHVGGVAYRTQSASHTLNVPAGRMSAFEDDPDGFLRFVRRREPALTGGSFVPRREYGEYLAETLDDARRSSPLPLLRVAGEVVSVSESGDDLILGLADGRSFPAERVVLAIGNYPPSDPPVGDGAVFTSIRYARDPWAGDALELDRRDDVLLVGTGLTMCDAALALRDADQQGRTHAISRRGLLPQPHRLSAKPPPHLDRPATLDAWPASAVGLLRGLRREVRERAGEDVDWREVVTSIRADTPALWQRLGSEERRRFLRHARPYWETHRHRSSPETAHAVEELVETGRLELVVGSLERLDGGRWRHRRHDPAARSAVERDPPGRQGDQLHGAGHRPHARARPARRRASAGRPDQARPAGARARHRRRGAAHRGRRERERTPHARRATP